MIYMKLYQKYRGSARVFTVEETVDRMSLRALTSANCAHTDVRTAKSETVRSSISTVQAKSIAILCGMCYIPTIDRMSLRALTSTNCAHMDVRTAKSETIRQQNIETPTWPVCVSKKT